MLHNSFSKVCSSQFVVNDKLVARMKIDRILISGAVTESWLQISQTALVFSVS